jgi:hypothetical protein
MYMDVRGSKNRILRHIVCQDRSGHIISQDWKKDWTTKKDEIRTSTEAR